MSDFTEVPEAREAPANVDMPSVTPPLADVPILSSEEVRAEMNQLISDSNPGFAEMRDDMPDAYEVRLNECCDIARSTFTAEMIGEWYNMSSAERAEVINDYGRRISEAMGIHFKGVLFDVADARVNGYNNGDGYVHLAVGLVSDPGCLLQVVDTVSHELRHQFQSEACMNPEKFGIDEVTAAEWRRAAEIYTTNDISYYDPIAYKYNPLETDARNFGNRVSQSIVRDWYKAANAA